jgi:hypothetical protein
MSVAVYIPELPSNRFSIRDMMVSIDRLRGSQNWETIDECLARISMDQLDALSATALARSTYAFRSELKNWTSFLHRAKGEFPEPASLWVGFTQEDFKWT